MAGAEMVYMSEESRMKKTVSGTAWSMVERLAKMGIQILCTFIIAQFVAPSEFGLVSMMSIFLAAGPDFFLNLKDIDLGAIDATIDGYKSKDKRAQVGLNLGGGIKLANHLQIGLNYQMPLGDSFTFKKIVDAVKDKEGAQFNTWQLSLAYTF